MINQIQEFVAEQTSAWQDEMQKIRTQSVETVRETAVGSAETLKSLKSPVRSIARSGVKITAVSQNAVASLIDDGEQPVTIEMKVNYLEAGEPGELVAHARVTRRGRRFTVVHADVTQAASGETVAEAMGTFTSI